MKLRGIVMISAAVAAGLFATTLSSKACTPADVPTITKGKITIAGDDYAPFSVPTSDGKLSGVDADIVKRIAADNCLEVVELTFDAAATVQAVVAGKADVAIGGWNRTEKRAKVVDISAPTYLDPMGFFSRDGRDTIESLLGKPVGTVSGYLWVGELQKLLGNNLKLYPNSVALAQDLEAGRIEVGLDGYTSGTYSQNTKGGYKGIQIKLAKPDDRVTASLAPPQAGIIYTKGNTALGKILDEGVDKQRQADVIKNALVKLGFDAGLANVGEPRMIK